MGGYRELPGETHACPRIAGKPFQFTTEEEAIVRWTSTHNQRIGERLLGDRRLNHEGRSELMT